MSTFDLRKGIAGFHAGGVFEVFTARFVVDFAAIIAENVLVVEAGNIIKFGDIPAGSILMSMACFIENMDTTTTPDPVKIGTAGDDDGFFTALALDDADGTMTMADGALKPGIGGDPFTDDTPIQLKLATTMPTDGVFILTALLARAKRA